MTILIRNNPPDKFFGKVSQSSASKAIAILSHVGLMGWLKCVAHADGFNWKFPSLSKEEEIELLKRGFLKPDGANNYIFDAMGGFSSVQEEKGDPNLYREDYQQIGKEDHGLRFKFDPNAGLMVYYYGEWLQVFDHDGEAYVLDWVNGRDFGINYPYKVALSMAEEYTKGKEEEREVSTDDNGLPF